MMANTIMVFIIVITMVFSIIVKAIVDG